MPLIPLELIEDPPRPVRSGTDEAADVALRCSIQALGLLQPVLLRPRGNEGYIIVCGRRRVRACRALGFAQIAAHVEVLNESVSRAAGVAENLVREPMPPLDQWRAIAEMRADGYTIEHAAVAIGVSLRHARQLEKLGAMHPDMLAAIEKFGLPDDDELARIACAPPQVQAAALKGVKPRDGDEWYRVAGACAQGRIPANRAIFDIAGAGIAFEEDLFLPPEAASKEFTTDVAGFLAAQEAALDAEIAARRAKKQRVQRGELGKDLSIKVPKGFVETYGDPQKPKRGETVLLAVTPGGYYVGQVISRIVKPKPAATKPEKATPAANDADGEGAKILRELVGDDEDDAESPPPAEEARTITAAGRALIAKAKTGALHDHLLAAFDRPAEELLAWLVIALSCHNVQMAASYPGLEYEELTFLDLVRELVPPEGASAIVTDNAKRCAAAAVARMLRITADQLNSPAEWIGHASGADAALPRLDTPEMLAQVSGAELKRVAAEHGIKPATKVAALREQLTGKLDRWRPAQFGAPGPRPRREDD